MNSLESLQPSVQIPLESQLPVTVPTVDELVAVTSSFRDGDRLWFDDVQAVLKTDLNDNEGLRLSNLDKIAPPALLIGHLATLTAINCEPSVDGKGTDIPGIVELPGLLHTFLQSMHNLSVNSANSPMLRDHIPYLLLEASAAWGVLRSSREFFKRRGLRAVVSEAQNEMQQAYEEGAIRWQIPEGSTVAFVGNGDPVASELQRSQPEHTLQIAAQKTTGAWTYLAPESTIGTTHEAFERANIEKAGEILILACRRTT